jgi:hypothetical protein
MRVWVLQFHTRTRHTRWVKDLAHGYKINSTPAFLSGKTRRVSGFRVPVAIPTEEASARGERACELGK